MTNPSDTTVTASGLKFGKECRLRHRTLVEGLFASGKVAYEYPLRLQWKALDKESLEMAFKYGLPPKLGRVQVMVTVPKRKRRRAVDRVKSRRRIREAYRLLRKPLEAYVDEHPEIASLQMAFIYMSSDDVPYAVISRKMDKLLSGILKKLSDGMNGVRETEQCESANP